MRTARSFLFPAIGALGLAAAAAAAAAGCAENGGAATQGGGGDAEGSGGGALGVAGDGEVEERVPAKEHRGGALRRGPVDEALYLADEDHDAVRVVPLPLGSGPVKTVAVPGGPAQVLPLDGKILVTVRDPGLLLVMEPDAKVGLREVGRVAVAADAWGVAVTPDEGTALVTSAWTHTVTGIDLGSLEKRFALDVAREPRAVVVRADGKSAYVTHLVGAELTRIDGLAGAEGASPDKAPSARRVDLAAGPLSAPRKDYPITFELDASLAYSAVLAPEGDRLFVPRHALGGYGALVWFGRPVVDVLGTAGDTQVIPDRVGRGIVKEVGESLGEDPGYSGDGATPVRERPRFSQPRDVVYRETTRTLLVASEGHDTLVEMDAMALDPALLPLRRYDLNGRFSPPSAGPISRCGAPSGVALSEDESLAFVHCRSTGDLAVVALDALDGLDEAPRDGLAVETIHLADDWLGEAAARGRQLFYNAWDQEMSGGLGCAGCHPDGRDDGHVWHEQPAEVGGMTGTRTHEIANMRIGAGDRFGRKLSAQKGYPRQTPMLAGRVSAKGPYAWHADARTLDERVRHGFGLHHWHGDPNIQWGADLAETTRKSKEIAAFLREGLMPPPMAERALTDEEARGKEVFESAETECATCHFPATGYTDRGLARLGTRPTPEGFDDDARRTRYKTPSLLFVGGTAPYYHEGSARTLRELVDDNHDRMGKTEHLGERDRAALVAYMETLGTVADDYSPRRPAIPAAATADIRVARRDLSPALPAPFGDPSTFTADPPGRERTAAPRRAEWKDAPKVALSRDRSGCEARRLREWVRIVCHDASLAKLIAGPREDVTVAADGFDAVLVFPVRRGEARLFTIERIASMSRWWFSMDTDVVVTHDWPEGAAAPSVRLVEERARIASISSRVRHDGASR